MGIAAVAFEPSIEETNFFEKGLQYSSGVEVVQDLIEAHKWFNIAALNGNIDARARRAELSEIMTDSQISAAQKAARDWLQSSRN